MPLAAVPPVLHLSNTRPEFQGAELLGLLAYPEPDHLDDRATAAFRFSYLAKPSALGWVSTADGGVAPLDRRTAEGGRIRLEERLQRRILAGKVAAQALHTLETGEPMTYLKGRPWTLKEALGQQAEDDRREARTNLHKRVWVTSTPVLHIAAAWVRAMLLTAKKTGEAPAVTAFMADERFLNTVLDGAQNLEAVVGRCPPLRVSENDLIRIRHR